MYPRASGGRPRPPPIFKILLHTVYVLLNIVSIFNMDFGISAKIQSCEFILHLRKNMITHSFTTNFSYFLLL